MELSKSRKWKTINSKHLKLSWGKLNVLSYPSSPWQVAFRGQKIQADGFISWISIKSKRSDKTSSSKHHNFLSVGLILLVNSHTKRPWNDPEWPVYVQNRTLRAFCQNVVLDWKGMTLEPVLTSGTSSLAVRTGSRSGTGTSMVVVLLRFPMSLGCRTYHRLSRLWTPGSVRSPTCLLCRKKKKNQKLFSGVFSLLVSWFCSCSSSVLWLWCLSYRDSCRRGTHGHPRYPAQTPPCRRRRWI